MPYGTATTLSFLENILTLSFLIGFFLIGPLTITEIYPAGDLQGKGDQQGEFSIVIERSDMESKCRDDPMSCTSREPIIQIDMQIDSREEITHDEHPEITLIEKDTADTREENADDGLTEDSEETIEVGSADSREENADDGLTEDSEETIEVGTADTEVQVKQVLQDLGIEVSRR